MRGATQFARLQCWRVVFQSTLLMRGATTLADMLDSIGYISIHAPHARSDSFLCFDPLATYKFQSTLLMRGATARRLAVGGQRIISIHAPHARSDYTTHSLCQSLHIFQSTLLMRGATLSFGCCFTKRNFNPRSSCEERRNGTVVFLCLFHFNPRSSCEERPY